MLWGTTAATATARVRACRRCPASAAAPWLGPGAAVVCRPRAAGQPSACAAMPGSRLAGLAHPAPLPPSRYSPANLNATQSRTCTSRCCTTAWRRWEAVSSGWFAFHLCAAAAGLPRAGRQTAAVHGRGRGSRRTDARKRCPPLTLGCRPSRAHSPALLAAGAELAQLPRNFSLSDLALDHLHGEVRCGTHGAAACGAAPRRRTPRACRAPRAWSGVLAAGSPPRRACGLCSRLAPPPCRCCPPSPPLQGPVDMQHDFNVGEAAAAAAAAAAPSTSGT